MQNNNTVTPVYRWEEGKALRLRVAVEAENLPGLTVASEYLAFPYWDEDLGWMNHYAGGVSGGLVLVGSLAFSAPLTEGMVKEVQRVAENWIEKQTPESINDRFPVEVAA